MLLYLVGPHVSLASACSASFRLKIHVRAQLSMRGAESAICIQDSGVKANYTLQLQGEPESKTYQFFHNGALKVIVSYHRTVVCAILINQNVLMNFL